MQRPIAVALSLGIYLLQSKQESNSSTCYTHALGKVLSSYYVSTLKHHYVAFLSQTDSFRIIFMTH